MTGLTFKTTIHFRNGRSGRRHLRAGDKPATPPDDGRVPRISRLMALAIHFDDLLRRSVVADQANLARLGRVTRARMTQITNLLHLAPDIQESLLFLPPISRGRAPIKEKQLRPITAIPDWHKQRLRWESLTLP